MRYLLNIVFFILCLFSVLPTRALQSEDIVFAPQLREDILVETISNQQHYFVTPPNTESVISATNSSKDNFSGNPNGNSAIQVSIVEKTPNTSESHSNAGIIHNIISYLKNEICTRAP